MGLEGFTQNICPACQINQPKTEDEILLASQSFHSLSHFMVKQGINSIFSTKALFEMGYIFEGKNSSIISRKPQYKDVYRRTIEMPQRTRNFNVNCCLKVHNAHLNLLSPIRDKVI